MTSIFIKLNLKDPREILVLNVSTSFEVDFEALEGVVVQACCIARWQAPSL